MLSSVRRLALLSATTTLAFGAATPVLSQDTITFVAATFAEAGRGDRLREWVDGFNASQDEVRVEPVAISFSNLANTVFTQMGGGGGPDIVRFDQTDFFAAIPSGRLLALDDMIDESQFDFLGPDQFMKVDDIRYGLLFDTTGYALLYNSDLVPEPPADFESFLAVAQEQTRDGNYGFAYRATMAERAGFWQDVCNFVFGFGGRWSDEDGNLTLNSPEVVAGIAAYKQVYDSGAIPRGTDAATYRRMFWEGRIAMNIDNGGVAAIFDQNAPELPFEVAPSPFPDDAQGLIMTALAVNANTQHPEATAAFINWAYQPENQASLLDAMGTNVGTSVALDDAALALRPWLPAYEAQMANALPQVVLGFEAHTPEIQQIVLEQVLQVLQANVDPQAAMDRAQTLAERMVQR
jgi:multiple sugar transport system substrate-binding protein